MADTYTVIRDITIDAPPHAIYPLIVDLRQWQKWSPWEGLDPDLHREYSGADAGVGARYAWSGNRKAGKGTMQITDTTPDGAVRIRVTFEKPMSSTSDVDLTLEPSVGATAVTWTMTGKHSLFSRIAAPLGLFDKLLGKDFEKGLAQLKTVAES